MKHPTSRMLFSYWDSLRGDRAAPERGEIEPGAIRHILAETFILDLSEPAAAVPVVDGYKFTKIDETTLEVELTRHQTVNALFGVLTERGVRVVSMRNKTNRLEELFVKLVGNGRES